MDLQREYAYTDKGILMDIRIWLINWFTKHTDFDGDEIEKSSKENYFECGWVDSFKFISFISEIEEHFGIYFSNDEFQNREFSTIEGLTVIIREKLDEK